VVIYIRFLACIVISVPLKFSKVSLLHLANKELLVIYFIAGHSKINEATSTVGQCSSARKLRLLAGMHHFTLWFVLDLLFYNSVFVPLTSQRFLRHGLTPLHLMKQLIFCTDLREIGSEPK